MFTVDPNLKVLRASREQIVSIVESINQPHVAVPGEPAQGAQAFVVGMRNQNGTFSVFIYLWLSVSRKPVIYAHAKKNLPLELYKDAEADALNFCESMGFMTDNLNFRNLGPSGQDEILKRLPPFQADPGKLISQHGQQGAMQPMLTGPNMSALQSMVPQTSSTPGPLNAVMAAPPTLAPAAPVQAGPVLQPEQVLQLARLLASF